jgi:hypothetical protein
VPTAPSFGWRTICAALNPGSPAGCAGSESGHFKSQLNTQGIKYGQGGNSEPLLSLSDSRSRFTERLMRVNGGCGRQADGTAVYPQLRKYPCVPALTLRANRRHLPRGLAS